jgi:hypothetical protein
MDGETLGAMSARFAGSLSLRSLSISVTRDWKALEQQTAPQAPPCSVGAAVESSPHCQRRWDH